MGTISGIDDRNQELVMLSTMLINTIKVEQRRNNRNDRKWRR